MDRPLVERYQTLRPHVERLLALAHLIRKRQGFIAARDPRRYPTREMEPAYIGESIGAPRGPDVFKNKVVYILRAEDLELSRIAADGEGRIIYPNQNGRLVNNVGNFAMDADGGVFILEFGQPETDSRHSTFFAGLPGAAFGEVNVKAGVLVTVNPNTGHYLTSPKMFEAFTKRLRDGLGVDLSRTTVSYFIR